LVNLAVTAVTDRSFAQLTRADVVYWGPITPYRTIRNDTHRERTISGLTVSVLTGISTRMFTPNITHATPSGIGWQSLRAYFDVLPGH
jgi:hypothetical protein